MEPIISLEENDFLDYQDKVDQNTDIFSANQVGSTIFFNDPITNIYSINEALTMFKQNEDLTSIPIEGDYGVIGLLLKSDLKNKKASFFNDLIDKKVDAFMRSTDNNVDAQESIEKVIGMLLEKDKESVFDDIPVFYKNKFYGVTNFRRLSKQFNANRQMDMQQGRNLQQFLMAKSNLQDIDCKVDIYNRMAHSLGGDFYKIIKLNDSLTLISSFDVAGKGISGSLSTAIISSFFTTIEVSEALGDFTPSQLVKLLNATIFSQTPSDVFVTAIFVFIDKTSEQYIVYNCGHTQLLVSKSPDAEIEEYVSSAPPLGIMDELPAIEEIKQTIPISNKTRLFIFSDGLTDIRNIEGHEFGEAGLKEFLTENNTTPILELSEKLGPKVEKFIGNAPQTDDITLISFQFENITAGQKKNGMQIIETVKKITYIESGYSAVMTITTYKPKGEKTIRFAKLYTSPEGFLLLVLKPAAELYSGYVYSNGKLQFFDTKQECSDADSSKTLFDSIVSVDKLLSLTVFQKAELLDITESSGNTGNQYYCKVQCDPDQVGLYINRETFLPIKKDFLDGDGQPVYSVEYKKWTGIANGYIASDITFVDTTRKGYKTEILYNNVKETKLDASVFTPEFIQKTIKNKK